MNAGKKLKEKWKESLSAVLPIILIVLALCFFAAPISPGILLLFLMGGVMLLVGMMFFTLGAEMAMTPMGERVGTSMTKTHKLWLILLLALLLGFIVTFSEPDLQVLAKQMSAVSDILLILTVAAGVGVFLLIAVLRMLLAIPLRFILIGMYVIVFALAFFVPEDFLPAAFDSGGVTTGPLTVPFIMALGIGISAVRSDRGASDDSFGLIAAASVGPILAVMALGLIYNPESGAVSAVSIPEIADSMELGAAFAREIPSYMGQIAVSLLPIIVFFFIYQFAALRLSGRTLKKIIVGLIYTYVGLVLFLTGANVGFMSAGNYLGKVIAGMDHNWILVPAAMLMGYFIVRAEPAVYVLNKQVEEITDGAVSERAMKTALSAGVAISLGIAMVRVLAGISALWILIPGYAIALGISFFVPGIYTAIAFDAGGVASGPMTAAFLLPLAQGACSAVGGNIATDAFGVVAMVAMTPLIAVQVMALAGKVISERKEKRAAAAQGGLPLPDEDTIIEL